MVEVKKLLKILSLILLVLFLTGCATCSNCVEEGGTENLDQLCALKGCPATDKKCNNTIRMVSIQETALSLGAQAGLAYRAKQINCTLDENSKNLDRIFNFNLMMLPHSVVPPVLVEGRQTMNVEDCQTIRISDRTYKIVKQACFVPTPPQWRDYLWMAFIMPERPFGTLLPQSDAERRIWCCFVTQGWKHGIAQADDIYAANLSRLKRDFVGMVRYRSLLAQHMVTCPYVARTELGVTGSCSDLRINDQVLRITALPCLQPDTKCWRPIVVDPCQEF